MILDAQIDKLKTAIAAAVRDEQSRDQLTGLRNDLALNQWIEDRLEDEKPFWLAFIELDHFKAVNTEFGYETGSAILSNVGDVLHSAHAFFSDETKAFRAHGDEFYLLGYLEAGGDLDAQDKSIAKALKHVTASISRIRTPTKGKIAECTASAGWNAYRTEDDFRSEPRQLLQQLEIAVSVAKRRGRGIPNAAPVRYRAGLEKERCETGRNDCTKCGTHFTYEIPVKLYPRSKHVFCAHCGTKMNRPPVKDSAETPV